MVDREQKRFPLLVGIGAFRTLAIPSAFFLFVGAVFQTLFLEGPDWPNGDVWRKIGYLGPVLGLVLFVSPLALLIGIRSVIASVRDALHARACDLILDAEGLRIEGGRAGGFTALWNEIHRGAITWDEQRGLVIALDGRTLVVPPPRQARELSSLRAVAQTLTATVRGHGVAGSEHRGPPGMIRCRECAAPLAPAAQIDVTCPFCHTPNRLSKILVTKVRAFEEVVASRRRDERLIRALVAQPPAWVANVVAFVGGGVMLAAAIATTTTSALFAFVDGKEAGMPRLHGVGPMWTGAALCWLAMALWLLSTRQALRLLTLGFGAIAPRRDGAAFACRECSGPLPEPAEGASLVDCAYCQTINVRAVDAYFHAGVLRNTEQQESLPQVLGRVARRRRTATVMAAMGALAIGVGGWWRLTRTPLVVDDASAVEVPFSSEKQTFRFAPVEPGPDAEGLERIAEFGEARLELLHLTGQSRVDVVAMNDGEPTKLFELGAADPFATLEDKPRLWGRGKAGLLAVTREGVDVIDTEGKRETLATRNALGDAHTTFVAGSPDGVFAGTRASPYGHLRLRWVRSRDEAPIIQEDVKEIAVHPTEGALVTTLVDGRFQLALLADPSARVATQLTTGKGHVRCPTWSPDGKRVAFVSASVRDEIHFGTRYGKAQLYVIVRASNELLTLTSGADLRRSCPVWTEQGIYVVGDERDEQGQIQRAVLRVLPRK